MEMVIFSFVTLNFIEWVITGVCLVPWIYLIQGLWDDDQLGIEIFHRLMFAVIVSFLAPVVIQVLRLGFANLQ